MKNRLRNIICFLLSRILLLMTGCAPKENTLEVKSFLPEFDTYYPYLGWHKASILEELGIQKTEFTEIDKNLYDSSKTVEYQQIPFHIYLGADSDCNWLHSFRYLARLDGDSASAAKKVFALTQALTAELDTPTSDQNKLLEKSIADLETWFTAGEQSGYSVTWEFGQLKTDSALAFRAFREGTDAYTETPRLLNEYPILRLTFSVYTDGTDVVKIDLGYSLECY